MQKPRPKEATAPRQQRSPHDADTSNRGASAPFVIPEGETTNRPASWDEIQVGSLVIAHESPEDGWWEAIVVAVENDQLYGFRLIRPGCLAWATNGSLCRV